MWVTCVLRPSKRSFGINTTLVLLIWKRKGDKITRISHQYGHTIGMEYLSLPSHNKLLSSRILWPFSESKCTRSWRVNVIAKNLNLKNYVTSYHLNQNSCPLFTWARIKATVKTEKEKASNQNERHCIAKVQTSFSNLTGNVISHSTMSNLAS